MRRLWPAVGTDSRAQTFGGITSGEGLVSINELHRDCELCGLMLGAREMWRLADS